MDSKGNWTKPQNLGNKVNSSDHDAVAAISADGKWLFLYKSAQGGNLYKSEWRNNEWSVPKSLGKHINSKNQEASITISADGNTVYFSSNRAGGQGGLDLYKATLGEDGEWSSPQNLGPDINTEFEEDAPFITSDGKTLYFSSSSNDNIGVYDIFKSIYNDKLDKWSKPQNLGVPVNSPEDDIFIVLTKDKKKQRILPPDVWEGLVRKTYTRFKSMSLL